MSESAPKEKQEVHLHDIRVKASPKARIVKVYCKGCGSMIRIKWSRWAAKQPDINTKIQANISHAVREIEEGIHANKKS